ncbi:lysyl oxidase homolog 2B-like [Lingula anatina]|uniref:Lysyl oxidase homolog 2B-like n=1 Tax=Lingula anatina TaxID=7574 RepID=A0A1S3KCM7_LINAN|nr:lysyl oxidase homolog 2B-like [Lingula anatina]|eukprot:XP_013420390.1 lysyl oxidase homolog 2B-like [Lingula anatina]
MCPGSYYVYQLPLISGCHYTYCGVPYSWNRNIRLVGGSTPYEGRVEVFYENEWGTICNRGNWNNLHAEAVCETLGYESNGSRVAGGGSFGSHSGVIWLSDVDCDEGEMSLFRCRHSDWGDTTGCTHSQDAGVICRKKSLDIGTRVPYFEKCHENTCYIEDPSFTTVQSARQTCQSIGGDVVLVDTTEESTILTEICLNSSFTPRMLLLGGTYNTDQWVWFTGEPVNPSVMSWAVGQPEDPSTQPYLCIDTSTGLWHDCTSDLQGVLCEIKYPISCSELGCCSGKNSSCKVELRSCYCDEHCTKAGDCCEDYVDTCRGTKNVFLKQLL